MATIKKRGTAAPKHEEQEIETLFHTVSAFVMKYRQQFQITAVAVLAGLVLAAGYTMYRSHQEQLAAPLISAAHELYEPGNGGQPDYQRALDLYREAQKRFPSTESGAIAQYYVGNCLVALGRPEEALKEYDTFVSRYSGNTFLLGLVQQRRGYTLKALGKIDDSRKAFEQAEALTGPGAATVELARMYEASGNMNDAQAKYKIVHDKLAGTSWSAEAMGNVQKISPQPAPMAAKPASK